MRADNEVKIARRNTQYRNPDLALFRRAIEAYDAGQFELAWQIAVAAMNGRFPEVIDSGFRAALIARYWAAKGYA